MKKVQVLVNEWKTVIPLSLALSHYRERG